MGRGLGARRGAEQRPAQEVFRNQSRQFVTDYMKCQFRRLLVVDKITLERESKILYKLLPWRNQYDFMTLKKYLVFALSQQNGPIIAIEAALLSNT